MMLNFHTGAELSQPFVVVKFGTRQWKCCTLLNLVGFKQHPAGFTTEKTLAGPKLREHYAARTV